MAGSTEKCQRCGQTEHRTSDERTCNLSMMQDPDRWPMWPRLPLKKKDDPRFGFLLNMATEGPHRDPTVWIGLVFGRSTDTPRIKYVSFDALFRAGWRVD